MKKISYISAVALILTGILSCQKNTAEKPEGNVFSYSLITKSDAEAGEIGTYSVYVIRERDSVVVACKTAATQAETTSIVDTFKNLPFENCIIAAVANGNIIEKYADSLEILHLKKGDKVSALALNRTVVCNSDSIASNVLMPFTGMSRLDIINSNTCNVALEKILARINITVNNNSGSSRLVVDSIYFNKFKGDRTFLFSHNGTTPDGITFSSLKGIACPNDTINANSSSSPLSWNLYECSANGYSVNIKLTVPEAERSVTVENIPLLLSDKINEKDASLKSIGRADDINVTINVYYDAEGNIFKFNVGNWESETINKNIN